MDLLARQSVRSRRFAPDAGRRTQWAASSLRVSAAHALP